MAENELNFFGFQGVNLSSAEFLEGNRINTLCSYVFHWIKNIPVYETQQNVLQFLKGDKPLF
jgi:hypothetical protein